MLQELYTQELWQMLLNPDSMQCFIMSQCWQFHRIIFKKRLQLLAIQNLLLYLLQSSLSDCYASHGSPSVFRSISEPFDLLQTEFISPEKQYHYAMLIRKYNKISNSMLFREKICSTRIWSMQIMHYQLGEYRFHHNILIVK